MPEHDWFVERLASIKRSPELQAYVAGVLIKFVASPIVLQHDSVVLAFADAKMTGDFVRFQELGDWVLWARSILPTVDNVDVIETLGRQSYEACHRLLGRQWRVYEELSQDLPTIARQVNQAVVLRV